MKFHALRPMLWTENIQESIDFYTTTLGFSLNEFNEDWQWASLVKDGVEIMLAKPNEHETFKQIGFSGSFYFTVENVDELWVSLKSKAKICYELSDFEWYMREFAIYDNKGYILQFGQEIN